MNEPSVFETLGNQMPDYATHSNMIHYEVRNLYGYEMQKTTYEALLKRETRPFLLSRSTFTGG